MSNEICNTCGRHWDMHPVTASICTIPPKQRVQQMIEDTLREQYENIVLREIVEEVHSWIVCACIATDADMMQNWVRISLITSPEYLKSEVDKRVRLSPQG